MVESKELDLRVRRTYKSLVEAFTRILGQKRYEDITVSDLCEAAMIRRTTFYKHFADKHEFFVFYVRSMRDEFRRGAEADPSDDAIAYLSQMIVQLVAFFLDNAPLVESALASNMFATMCDMLTDEMARELRTIITAPAMRAGVDELQVEWTAAFIAGGILQSLCAWWGKRGIDPHGEKVAATLSALYARVLDSILE